MRLTKDEPGRFSVYIDGTWMGNVVATIQVEEVDVELFFSEQFPNDKILVWDNWEA